MHFGERLRELRKQASLSQRELAEAVDIDFTYLSKIENSRLEPPSEPVIRGLSRILADKLDLDEIDLADDLITLAGKIPSDLAQKLYRNREAIRFLRSLDGDIQSGNDWSKVTKPNSEDTSS